MFLSQKSWFDPDLIGITPDDLPQFEVPTFQQRQHTYYNNILSYFMKSCLKIDSEMAAEFAEEQRIQIEKMKMTYRHQVNSSIAAKAEGRFDEKADAGEIA